jgi:hypothetical protein
MNNSALAPNAGQIVAVNRCDRWSIHYRLQDLNIPSACHPDGTLRVDVNHATALVLTRSTIRQFIDSRQAQLDWLERCWTTPILCHADH